MNTFSVTSAEGSVAEVEVATALPGAAIWTRRRHPDLPPVLGPISHADGVGKDVGPWLVGIGIAVAVVGGLAWAGWLSWLGRLPGDIRFTSGNTKVFIPITSMLILSVVLSLVLSLIRRR
jgi:phosphotransferase system  glucose/maltose/N-acetylglucosamine-specific IIC component